jgi:hypothetical protein
MTRTALAPRSGTVRPARAPRAVAAPRARRGQSTVEYVMIIAVLLVGLLVAAYAFLPGFSQGVTGLKADATQLLSSGGSNGAGDMR